VPALVLAAGLLLAGCAVPAPTPRAGTARARPPDPTATTAVAVRELRPGTAAPVASQAPTGPATAATAGPAAFGDGVFRVGADVAAGTYRADADGCYWARLKGLSGEIADVLANGLAAGPAVVTILPSDAAFQSRGCRRWVDVTASPGSRNPDAALPQGTYLVGTDVAPGTWRAPGGERCYWARLRDFTGTVSSIVANDVPAGPASVRIAASDVGFESRGCGSWTRVG